MDEIFESDIDPTIAAMLADVNDSQPESETTFDDFPSEDIGFSTENIGKADVNYSGDVNADPWRVDTRRERIKEVKKLMEDEAQPFFSDKNYDNGSYYKTALEGEGQQGQRVNQLLKRYLTTQDPKEKTQYRLQMVSSWWELVRVISRKLGDRNFPMAKRMLMRFGVALPSLFTPEQKDLFSRAIFKNETGEPVYYLDEWLEEVSKNHIALSATDEKHVRIVASGENAEQQKLIQLKAKNDGRLQTAEGFANAKESERQMLESELKTRIDALCEHERVIGLDGRLRAAYTDSQKAMFADIFERLRGLQKLDKDLAAYLRDLEEAKEIGISLDQKLGDVGANAVVDSSLLDKEFGTVRQMAKMTCGRRGNTFPVFTREFYHCPAHGTGFREEVINILRWIEMNDRSVFKKKAKGLTNRVLPFVLLVPTYGDFGFCWQPFDRMNRATSRGRLVIPMYPKNLKIALLMAVADYRWQYAKEKAVDWTDPEDGICGQYYQYIESKKIKGDLKSYFIADYVTWMTKEIVGTQVLEKELRGIFWRNLPFCKERREELSKRSMAYLDLYKKDAVRIGTFTKEEMRDYEKNNKPYDSLHFPGEPSSDE